MLIKLVDPEPETIRAGMNQIIENYSGLEEYIKLIPKIRKQFKYLKKMQLNGK